MSKFGALIDSETPVLIGFYTKTKEGTDAVQSLLKKVAVAVAENARVVKMEAGKNHRLVDALKIKGFPAFVIYKDGKMIWRNDDVQQDADTLIDKVKEHV